MTLLFESEVCGRCGGSGEYSYNAKDGTRCYGCNGKRERLTKRGAAAQAFLNELRSRTAAEIQVGDVVLFAGWGKNEWVTVTAVGPDTLNPHLGNLSIDAVKSSGEACSMSLRPDGKIAKQFSAEENAAQREQALAYQATLTKNGTPRKR